MDLVYRCHFKSPSIIWRRRWRGICHCCAVVELNRKKQVVFMGSPTVAANVLDKLLDASHLKGTIFDVSAIVTQPASGRLRGRKDIPSPVAQRALDRSFPSDRIFTPEKAGEENFLADLRELKPDLCVTAAYGNILPNRFLEIPKHGTVNIHPSLLPLYRGAAPVQRALQDGVQVTGVSVAFSVRALDAGPVIACESLEIDDSVKAPDLLSVLFDRGIHILLRELPSILNGSAATKALEQDESMASVAPKEKQEVSPIAETLAQSIVDQCQEKMRPYLIDEELAGPAVHVQQKTVKEEDPLDEEQGKSSSLVKSISLSSNICMPSEVTEKGIMKEEQKDNSDLHMVKSSLGNEAPKKDDDFQFKKIANVTPKGQGKWCFVGWKLQKEKG